MNRAFAMSTTIPTTILFLFGMITFLTGCQSDKNASAANPNVTDVTTTSTPAYASTSSRSGSGYTPAPQAVTYDTMPSASSSSTSNGYSANTMGGGSISGGSYTVKKGDTLYGIARAKYGDGKQWQKIASANPGLSPSSLKVGQTITLP